MSTATATGLEVSNLSVRYGGLHAVAGLSLEVPAARLTGLIGPNGAGKTTTFNALSGLVRPSGGTIRLFGADVAGLGPAARAQAGLGRTFQRMELFDSLTVDDNVVLGREAAIAGAIPWRHVFRTKADKATVEEAVEDAIELCGLAEVRRRRVGALSTGQRRLVELARCIAGPFTIMLLDEPSSGLDAFETKRFGAILRKLVERREVGILLVEHDMALVMDVCDYIYVVDFGALIFQGTPADVSTSDVVRAAYLGSDALEGASG